MEIVHDGWLWKSPPPKTLWRAKWRNRWFVLRSGELPGQYFLEYYTDSTCRKMKGKIDLDQCEQVDAGITFANRKFEYKYMFDIKTPKRVYYLCAETEDAMNRWVEGVCQVCGLKVMNQDDMFDPVAQLANNAPPTPHTSTPPLSFDPPHRGIDYPCGVESPPPSASSTISGPYIPISECITGKKSLTSTKFPFTDDLHLSIPNDLQRSSIPTEMAPPAPFHLQNGSNLSLTHAAQSSRYSGAKPKDMHTASKMQQSEETKCRSPHRTESGGAYLMLSEEDRIRGHHGDSRKSEKLYSDNDSALFLAPPRPPKPPYLAEGQNYMNVETIVKVNLRRNSSSDKSRSCGNSNLVHLKPDNIVGACSDPERSPAATSLILPNMPREPCDISNVANLELSDNLCKSSTLPQSNIQKRIFSYDSPLDNSIIERGEKESEPRPSPTGIYSNISQVYVPPLINRDLKPKKCGESNSLSPSEFALPLSSGAIVTDGTSNECSNIASAIPHPPSSAPPIIDRKLKPQKKISESSIVPSNVAMSPNSINNLGLPTFILDPAPRCRNRNSSSQSKPRAAPSPTPPSRGYDTDSDSSSTPGSRRNSTADEQVFFPLSSGNRRSSHEIQYLDLDLELQTSHSPKPSLSLTSGSSKVVPLEPSVVYKKVDFVKTEALSKMRQNVEEGYRKNQS